MNDGDSGNTDNVESYRRIIEQQSALVQSLNDEINRIARLHAVTLGVGVTGVSIGVKAGLVDPGIAARNLLSSKAIGVLLLVAAGIVGLSEIRLLWRGGPNFFESPALSRLLPDPFPAYYTNFELEPTPDSIEYNNQELIAKTEKKIGILHLHFLLLVILLLSWLGIHTLFL